MYRSPFYSTCRLTGGFPYYDSDGLKQNSHRSHTGQDYVAADKSKEENWQLYAIDDGEVTGVSSSGDYGNHITYSTSDGKSVLYAHLKSRPIFKVGAKLLKGEYIGTAGSTGNSTGRHLHIEIQNSPKWKYGQNLLKPSDYIDFNDHSKNEDPGDDFNMPKTWTNGSTKEHVYQTTTDCKAKKRSIGSLAPHESCDCYGIVDGVYLVSYKVNGTDAKKCGYVLYSGGVK